MKALDAMASGRSPARTLRLLRVCGLALVLAAGPAMAGSVDSASFTVGIRIQSEPSAAPTPEQLNARNKMLYEEQKKIEAMALRPGALDSAFLPAQMAGQANRSVP